MHIKTRSSDINTRVDLSGCFCIFLLQLTVSLLAYQIFGQQVQKNADAGWKGKGAAKRGGNFLF
jgi:hypothetical protein